MAGQHTLKRGDHNEVAFWLVFDVSGSIRLTRGRPDLSRNERGMAMLVRVPHALFKTASLSATMTIEAPDPVVPPIDLTAATEALKQALGVDIDVRIVMPEDQ